MPRPHLSLRHAPQGLVLSLLLALGSSGAATLKTEQLQQMMASGQLDQAQAQLNQLERGPAASRARLQLLLLRQDFDAARPLVQGLMAQARPSAEERGLIYQWLQASDDQAALAARLQPWLKSPKAAAVDWLAEARQALELREFERADKALRRAQTLARNAYDRAEALKGLGQIAYQQRRFDDSLKWLEQSLAQHRHAENEQAMAETLVRLGRTDDAVSASERSIALNPYYEPAHYYLGNGYTRLNYSQLEARDPEAFKAGMALVRSASDAFVRKEFRLAREQAAEALRRCPGLGRAHAILARALESERFMIDVHRADAEARFAAQAMPEIPMIERYVLNWSELSPRHQKRVAMSIAPWRAFIPVLVAGGATHYIKPLYQRLSETPEAQSMKDTRIDYDSRLWDDVRGMGGHHTVTGIEDVERSIFDRYNTVLHELSHQVHGVLTADQWRRIQDLYREAKQRDAKTQQGFLSRYAGGSVWEYFAEGANALDSPRRDAFDPREIVRERLSEIDPALQAYVAELFALKDASASLPIALVSAAHEHLSHGELDAGQAKLNEAAQHAPDDESVLSARIYALSLRGDAQAARQLIEQARGRHPHSGSILVASADALWHSGEALPAIVQMLSLDRAAMPGEDARKLALELAAYQARAGQAEAALKTYEQLLSQQSDMPEALWGKAASLAQLKRWDEALPVYQQALRLRTGLVALRADLVSQLLMAGHLEPARQQLKEALLLNAKDASLQALQAWLTLRDGNATLALTQAQTCLDQHPDTDLALMIRAAAERRLGQADRAEVSLKPLRERIAKGTGPHYKYRKDDQEWQSVGAWTAQSQALWQALLGSAPH